MLLVAMFVGTQINAAGIEFQDLTLKEGLAKAKKENKQVFIDVYATWCGPCKYLTANIFTDDDLGEFMNKHFINLKIDGEKTDGIGLMTDYDLDAYPTMLFLSPEKEMKKKLVGVVSAPDIKKAGKGVVFPETTAMYKLQKQYDNGERDRSFMQDYIMESIDEGKDPEGVVSEYLELYPKLDLKDSKDFAIFCVGVEDLDNVYMTDFIKNAGTYNEMHSDLVPMKMESVIIGVMEDAVLQKEPNIINQGVDKVYNAYKEVYGDESFRKREIDRGFARNL